MKRVLYMHTLDGQPAQYYPRKKLICIPNSRQPIKLARSLRQIRLEQQISRTQRVRDCEKYNWSASDLEYGYQRVDVTP